MEGADRAILGQNGLISFIAHPDYLVEPRAHDVYSELLGHLNELRDQHDVWIALPARSTGGGATAAR